MKSVRVFVVFSVVIVPKGRRSGGKSRSTSGKQRNQKSKGIPRWRKKREAENQSTESTASLETIKVPSVVSERKIEESEARISSSMEKKLDERKKQKLSTSSVKLSELPRKPDAHSHGRLQESATPIAKRPSGHIMKNP